MSANLTPGMSLTDDRGPQVIRAIVACSVLSGLAFAARIVSRKMLKAKFLVSDYLVAFGLLSAWLLSSLALWSEYNLGLILFRHILSLRGRAHPLQVSSWVWESIFRWFRLATSRRY